MCIYLATSGRTGRDILVACAGALLGSRGRRFIILGRRVVGRVTAVAVVVAAAVAGAGFGYFTSKTLATLAFACSLLFWLVLGVPCCCSPDKKRNKSDPKHAKRKNGTERRNNVRLLGVSGLVYYVFALGGLGIIAFGFASVVLGHCV